MTQTLMEPPAVDAPQLLRERMAAARLSFTWLGVRKSLSAEQKARAADPFGAEGKYLSAGKKLLDTSHPAFKAVTAVRGQTQTYWKSISLPFPEPGIRLIRQDQIEPFDARLREFQAELEQAVAELDQHYDELRQAARQRLGDLFDPSDYPVSLWGLFAIEHDFPSVEPPDYLRQLQPELYEQECQRVRARFSEAVALAEQTFGEELARLVEHLSERLSSDESGKTHIFRDSAIGNLTEFFQRFQQLNIGSSAELDQLVEQAHRILGDVAPGQLRENASLRERVRTQMAGVQAGLDQWLVERPRRNLLRKSR
ncbi:MAG: hypothetical protein R3C12_21145 [Planctomycetaceae bacterium]